MELFLPYGPVLRKTKKSFEKKIKIKILYKKSKNKTKKKTI